MDEQTNEQNCDQLNTTIFVEESKTEVLADPWSLRSEENALSQGDGGYTQSPDGGMFRAAGIEDGFSIKMQTELGRH